MIVRIMKSIATIVSSLSLMRSSDKVSDQRARKKKIRNDVREARSGNKIKRIKKRSESYNLR